METNKTELVFILDKSGSMSGLESDTIGGFNSMLNKQQEEKGEAAVTTVLFDNNYELLHDRININGICPITEKEYFVGGTTALLDAVGRTIRKIDNALKHTNEEYRPDKVMFVIITDGLENASREYSYEKVRKMIENQKNKCGWEFIFLGANIDAISAAERFGIRPDRAANYNSDSKGTRLNYEVVSCAISKMRENKSIGDNWKEEIDKDYELRRKSRR